MEAKFRELQNYSNPRTVSERAMDRNLNDVYLSTRKTKKYMIQDPKGKWVHFGAMGMEDFTKHKDQKRRENYLKRSGAIRGDWKRNPYSPNNLARNLLW